MTTLLEHAQELSDIHGHQDAVIAKEVGSMVGQLNGHPHFPSLVHQMLPVIIDQHAQAAGLYTAHWYDGIEPGGKFQAKPMVDIPPEQIAKSIDWALYAPGEEPTASRLTGSSQRMVRNASRDTIIGNAAKENVRWARYAKPTACAYCRALAMRGSGREDQKWLYHTEQSAIYRKSDGEKYHTHCECEPVPVRGGLVWTPPDYTSDWDQQYVAASKQTARGPKYFQRIVAQMRSNEPQPEPETEPAPTPEVPQAPPAPTPLHPKVMEAAAAQAHQELRDKLDAATDFKDINTVARKLLPDTDVDTGHSAGDVLLRQADYGSPGLWDQKAPAVQENIKGVLRAVDDVMTKYPGLQLDSLEAAADQVVFGDPNIYAHADHNWDKDAFMVRMNRSYVANPGKLQDSWDTGVKSGFHYEGGDNPAYAIITHEMGHVIQQNAEARGVTITDNDINRALATYYVTTGGPITPDAYNNWLTDNLSGYSTHSTLPLEVRGKLRQHAPDLSQANPINGREALAEAFADVEINGDDAHETSIVLHGLLIDAYHQAMAQESDSGLAAAV
jgi:hypothetical protein